MKFLIVAILFIMTLSCSTSDNSYRGYVYYQDTPLESVLVIEDGVTKVSTQTDKEGFFLLKKHSEEFTRNLIFKKKGYRIDTVITFRGGNSSPLYFLFSKGRSDTLFMSPK